MHRIDSGTLVFGGFGGLGGFMLGASMLAGNPMAAALVGWCAGFALFTAVAWCFSLVVETVRHSLRGKASRVARSNGTPSTFGQHSLRGKASRVAPLYSSPKPGWDRIRMRAVWNFMLMALPLATFTIGLVGWLGLFMGIAAPWFIAAAIARSARDHALVEYLLAPPPFVAPKASDLQIYNNEEASVAERNAAAARMLKRLDEIDAAKSAANRAATVKRFIGGASAPIGKPPRLS